MQSSPPTREWTPILMIGFCGISALLLFIISIFLVLSGIFQLLVPQAVMDSTAAVSSMLLGTAAGFGGLLVLPAMYYNWQSLTHKTSSDSSVQPVRFWQILVLGAITLLALFFGNQLLQSLKWTAILTPVFFLLAAVLPILVVVWISISGLRLGSRRRLWNTFVLGMILGPFCIMVLEIILVFFLFLLLVVYLSLQPDLVNQLLDLSEQLVKLSDPQAILNLLFPYLNHPLVLLIGAASISLLIPLIEEFIKPAGIWFLGRNALTAQEGFALGILSGAAFAIFESLGNGSNATEGWGLLMLARIGTDLVHILGTGLMGWAMAISWQDKRYLRLLVIYLLVVMNHGIWNAQVILVVVNDLAEVISSVLPSQPWVSVVFSVGLSLQAVGMLGILVWINHHLRPKVETV